MEKFFANTESAVLFPEFVSRAVRQGMQEENILPAITATVTNFNGMDYRSIKSDTDDKDKPCVLWLRVLCCPKPQ